MSLVTEDQVKHRNYIFQNIDAKQSKVCRLNLISSMAPFLDNVDEINNLIGEDSQDDLKQARKNIFRYV